MILLKYLPILIILILILMPISFVMTAVSIVFRNNIMLSYSMLGMFLFPALLMIMLLILVIIHIMKSPQTLPYKTMSMYEQEIENYVKNHKPKNIMKNAHCKLFINDYGEGLRIRVMDNKNYKNVFEVVPVQRLNNKEDLISTFWVIIQMYFNPKITYDGIKFWFRRLGNYMKDYEIQYPKI